MLPHNCIIHILYYLQFKKLRQLTIVSKNFHIIMDHVIKLYPPKRILHALRYAITIDDLSLFIYMQKYASHHHMFYLLRYACRKQNEVFVNYILPYNNAKLIQRCIMEILKSSNILVYNMYFYLVMTNLKESVLIKKESFIINFLHQFYSHYYIKFYDEFDYRWRMFDMDI